MRRYETIAIIDPDLSEDDRTSLLTRIKEIIPQQEGVVIKEDLWGSRKLAYPIKKKPRGYYARYDYCGMGKAVEELERFFRIDDRVVKYLTVLLNPDVDPEKIKAEMAEAEAASAPAAKTEATEPAKAPAAATEATEPIKAPAATTESEPVDQKPAEPEAAQAADKESDAPAPTDESATETSEKE
jgi:small subunit ribosomal protein S6